MEENDPRFKPIKEQDGFALVPDRWKIDYFASAGELSRFFIELKENAKLRAPNAPSAARSTSGRARGATTAGWTASGLSLIHISEPTRLGMISYAVFCLK